MGKPELGTEEFPFLIENVFDYIAFRNEMIIGNTFSGIHHKVTNNIDFTGFTIPYQNAVYEGHFHGNYKVFKNIIIDDKAPTFNSTALFGSVNGILENLAFINVYINRLGKAGINNNTGAIGYGGNGIIRKVYVQGIIIQKVNYELAGIATQFSGLIENCVVDFVATKDGGYGYANIINSRAQQFEVRNCLSKGTINGGSGNAFGICRTENSSAKISNCVNLATINATLAGTVGSKRIAGGHANTPQLINNYSLDTALLNNAIPTIDIGASLRNGANATETQLKSLAFYRDTMGWDMDTIWEIVSEDITYPRLRGFNYTF
jgi:hypothetical protein